MARDSDTSPARTTVLAPYADWFDLPVAFDPAPRLDDLTGRAIGLVDNRFPALHAIHAALRRELGATGCTFVTIEKPYWKGLDEDVLAHFARRAEAFVSGLCNTPPSTRWNIQEAAALERAGRPTVTLVTEYYDALAHEIARSEGIVELRRITLPYPIESLSGSALESLAARVVEHVVAALTSERAPRGVRLTA